VLQVESDEATSSAFFTEKQVTSSICRDLSTTQLAVVRPVQYKAGTKTRLEAVRIAVQRERLTPAQMHHFARYQRCPTCSQMEQSRTATTG
jgi:hypothetical protein